jgi:hypothetical protein
MAAGMLITWFVSIFIFSEPPLDSQGAFIGNDFVTFYTGASLWKNGQSEYLYDLKTQQAFQNSLVSHLPDSPVVRKKHQKILPFIHPPTSIFLCLPFAQWGYIKGLVLWWLFGFFCLGISIFLMRKHIPGLHRYSAGKLWGMTLVFFPTLSWVIYGQATAIILCLWILCYSLLRLKREFWAGFILSFLVFKPQLALAFALPLIVTFRFRALLGGIVGLGCWAGLTNLIFPEALFAYQNQIKTIFEILRHESYPFWQIHSFYGFANLIAYPVSSKLSVLISVALSVLGILFCVGIWWKAEWNPDSDEWNTRLAVSIPICLLLAVQLFTYDLMLLLFPYFLIMSQMRYWNRSRGDYLDGGPVLAWTSLVFVTCFLSAYFVKAQQIFFKAIHIPQLGLQISVFCIIGWCWAVWQHHKQHVVQRV